MYQSFSVAVSGSFPCRKRRLSESAWASRSALNPVRTFSAREPGGEKTGVSGLKVLAEGPLFFLRLGREVLEQLRHRFVDSLVRLLGGGGGGNRPLGDS